MLNGEFIEIRCPEDREHEIKDTKYSTCGQLLGGLMDVDGNSAIFRCPVCRTFWKASIEDDVVTMDKESSKNKRVQFKKQWRLVHG